MVVYYLLRDLTETKVLYNCSNFPLSISVTTSALTLVGVTVVALFSFNEAKQLRDLHVASTLVLYVSASNVC